MSNNTHVILVTVDCLRADHLHCYGYLRETTPFIDWLAREGALFKNAFANGPFTAAAFPALLTSTYALDNGRCITLENRTFVSEILQKEGTKTAALHSNPYLSSQFGYDRGFDYFEDFFNVPLVQGGKAFSVTKALQEGNRIVDRALKFAFLRNVKSVVKNYITLREEPFISAKKTTEYAINWIDKTAPHPFFLWIHYMDLHEPYLILHTGVTQKYSKNVSRLLQSKLLGFKQEYIHHIIDIYDDKLRFVDLHVKMLHSFLKKVLEDPVIIITSDHGQEFYEHNRFGHRARYYDEILHIPLIVHGTPVKMQTDSLRSQLDIPPTILSLSGITPPSAYCGSSLFSDPKDVVISESSHSKEGLYITDSDPHNECTSHACRTKKWKYIHQYNREELYNIKEDPGEKHNVVAEYPDIVARFRKILHEHNKNRSFAEKERISGSIERLKTLKKI